MCRFKKLPGKLKELILNKLYRTSLYSLHRELNAKTIPFAGYEMPVNYPLGILNEHIHCRKSVGLFDVSHMGQIKISSKSISMHDLARELEKLIPIDLVSLSKDRQRYGFLTNEKGGVIDDLMISNRGNHFFVVVNASRKEIDKNYLREKKGVTLFDTKDLICVHDYRKTNKTLFNKIKHAIKINKIKIKGYAYGKTIYSGVSPYITKKELHKLKNI